MTSSCIRFWQCSNSNQLLLSPSLSLLLLFLYLRLFALIDFAMAAATGISSHLPLPPPLQPFSSSLPPLHLDSPVFRLIIRSLF